MVTCILYAAQTDLLCLGDQPPLEGVDLLDHLISAGITALHTENTAAMNELIFTLIVCSNMFLEIESRKMFVQLKTDKFS